MSMTPEERFTRMEKLASTLREGQALHEADVREIREIREIQKKTDAVLLKLAGNQQGMAESQLRMAESHSRLADSQDKLAKAQAETEAKLNALIETVDRLIRDRGGPFVP